MKREKIYIIKSKNANKHIVPDYAVLENEYKNSILTIINCKMSRFNLCNSNLFYKIFTINR